MGQCLAKEEIEEITPVVKEGVKYEDYKSKIKPLALVLFKGKDYVSDFIRYVQSGTVAASSNAGFDIPNDSFSHSGIIVTREILNDERLEEGKLYILESTMSGILSDGVDNIDGVSYFGVQLRDFDLVVEKYDKPDDTVIAVANIDENILEGAWNSEQDLLKGAFTSLFQKYNGVRYDANLVSLFSTTFHCLRPIRDVSEEALGTQEWLFCSELIAVIYQELGLYPSEIDPRDVVPMDFIGFDVDKNKIPVIVEKPVYIVSSFHSVKNEEKIAEE